MDNDVEGDFGFCGHCGRKRVLRVRDSPHYNQVTGKKTPEYYIECPKYHSRGFNYWVPLFTRAHDSQMQGTAFIKSTSVLPE